MKKLLAIVLTAAMLLAMLCACAAKPTETAATDTKATIGILMPTKEQTIWSIQGERLTEAFQKAGYATQIEYAEDDSAKQAMQIENMNVHMKFATTKMMKDLLERVDFTACHHGRASSTWLNSFRSLTFNVVRIIRKAASNPTAIIDICSAKREVLSEPAFGRKKSGTIKPINVPSRPKRLLTTESLPRSISDSVSSGKSAP